MNFTNSPDKNKSFLNKIRIEDNKIQDLNKKISRDEEINKIDHKKNYFNQNNFSTQSFFPKNIPKEEEEDKNPFKPYSNRHNNPLMGKIKEDGRIKLKMIDMIITKQFPLSLNVLSDDNHIDIKNHAIKENNYIKGVSSLTRQGQVRSENDDRITVLLNIGKPENIYTNKWPFCCFLGVYSGHKGSSCADFLKDNLHNYILRDKVFIEDPKQAIKNGFVQAEKIFSEEKAINKTMGILQDKSGSTALICILVDDICYFANLGNSRAFFSSETGKNICQINSGHTPANDSERSRIITAGGKIYQKETSSSLFNKEVFNNGEVFVGPLKIFPGRLSISRCIGDLTAKFKKYGGLENLYITKPDIYSLKIIGDLDFLVIGSNYLFKFM